MAEKSLPEFVIQQFDLLANLIEVSGRVCNEIETAGGRSMCAVHKNPWPCRHQWQITRHELVGHLRQVSIEFAEHRDEEGTERCPQCKGGGTHPDHDRGCPGGGPICEAQCPVEVVCDLCRGKGLVRAEVARAKERERDDDMPF